MINKTTHQMMYYHTMSDSDLSGFYKAYTSTINLLLDDMKELASLQFDIEMDKDPTIFREVAYLCSKWKCENPFNSYDAYAPISKEERITGTGGVIDLLGIQLVYETEKINKLYSYLIHTDKLHVINL